MRIETLHEFIVLTDYTSFTAAANALHISQPSLSKHIAELEQEVGAPLFTRERSLKLTPVGSAFLEDAIQIYHLYESSLAKAKEMTRHSKQELVIQEPYIVDLLGEILFKSVMHFKAENPYVAASYYSESGKSSIELLEQGKIDVAMTVDNSRSDRVQKLCGRKGLVAYPIVKEPLQVWLHKDHPLASKEHLTLIDLARTTVNVTTKRNFEPMRLALVDLFKRATDAPPHLQTFPCDTLDEFFMNTNNKSAVFLVTPAITRSPLLTMQRTMVARPIDDDAYLVSYFVLRENYDKQSIESLRETVRRVIELELEHAPGTQFLSEITTA